MPVKGKVAARLLGKLVWGLSAAITEFLPTLPPEVGIHKMTSRSIWMPVDGDCVVSGQISGSATVGQIYLVFSFVPVFFSSDFQF
jgi:hypothetical protein